MALCPVKRRGGIYWFCNCDCGNNTLVKTSCFGSTKSCGCLQKEHYNSMQKEFERDAKEDSNFPPLHMGRFKSLFPKDKFLEDKLC